MKCLIRLVSIILVVALSTSVCFATTNSALIENAKPYYVETQSITELFTINSTGKASMKAILVPISSSSIDEVKITLKIKDNLGVNVYSKTFSAEWNSLFGRYELFKNYQLPKKGTYNFQAIYKCYKNGSLVETINSPYKTDSY